MGFKNFYHFVDKNGTKDEFLSYDDTTQSDSTTMVAPWLLVDFNNLYSISLQCGGHNSLGYSYCKEFLIALFTSNYRIMLFLDGECDSLRSVTKLERMVNDVVRISTKDSVDVSTETLCPEMGFSYPSLLREEVKDLVDRWLRDNQMSSIIYKMIQVPKGEADHAIRKVTREKIALNEKVIILSDDASLILGVPLTVCIASPSRLSLRRSNNTSRIQLFGPIIPIETFVTELRRVTMARIVVKDKILSSFAKKNPITESMLVHIAALLGGDHDNCDFEKDSNPFIMNKFLSKLFLEHKIDDDIKNDRLIAAAAIVILWKANELYSDVKITLTRVMGEIIDCAKLMTNRARNHFDSFNGLIFGISRTVFQGSYFDANNVGMMNVENLVSCLRSRLLESSNSNSRVCDTQYHYGKWGLWCSTLEPRGESTELILSPLTSLVRQARFMKDIDVSLVLDDNVILENAQAFNVWMKSAFTATNADTQISTLIANDDDNNVDDDEDEEFNCELPHKAPNTETCSSEEDSEGITNVTIIWETSYEHKSSENEFTSRTLYEHCIINKTLPSRGFLVSETWNYTSEDGLRWFSYDEGSIDDLGLLICERYPGFRALDGAAYDLRRRYSVLTTCREVYHREGKGPLFMKHILDIDENHPDHFQMAVEAVKIFWECDLDINCYMNGVSYLPPLNDLPSLPAERSAINESALAVVAMLYCLVSSFSRVRLLDHTDLDSIIEGCLLSPLFAQHASNSNPILNKSVKDMEKKLESYHSSFDKALSKAKGSVSDKVIGTRRHVRWVEVIEILLDKIIIPLVPSKEFNLYTHWFDAWGILMIIRLNSIPLNNLQGSFHGAGQYGGMKLLPQRLETGQFSACGDVAKVLKLTQRRGEILSDALVEPKSALYKFLSPITSKSSFDLNSVKTVASTFSNKSTPKYSSRSIIRPNIEPHKSISNLSSQLKGTSIFNLKPTSASTMKVSDHTIKEKELAFDGYYEDYGSVRTQKREKAVQREKGNI